MYYRTIKHSIDFCFAVVLSIVFLPVMVVLWVLLYTFSPLRWYEVLFLQKRIGYLRQPFTIFKFRTLKTDSNDNADFKMGSFLRKSGLDELPQLFNIIAGDMSFVGPRPLLPEYTELMSSEIINRYNVRPGVTGLVQVSGGKNLSWDRKFELDVTYVQNLTFILDMKILIKTIFVYLSLRRFAEDDNRKRFDDRV